MGLVYGKDVLLTTPNPDTHEDMVIGCSRSCTFDISMDTIETSTINSGNFRTYTTGALTFSGTIDGLTLITDGTTASYDLGRLYDAIIAGIPFGMKFYETDVENTYYLQKECTVIIESINETASFDNITTCSVNFKGTGPVSITYGTI